MPHHCLHLPLCFSLNRSATTYAYLLQLYLAITSDHHSHWSLCMRPPFLLNTFLFILSIPFGIHCLIFWTTFQYLFPCLTIFSYTASLSRMPPYAHPPSTFQLSVLFLLVVLLSIYLGTYSPTHSSIILLAHHCLVHSSEYSSCSYWSITRLGPLDELDNISTSSCIYTYHE